MAGIDHLTSDNPLLQDYDLFPFKKLKIEHVMPAVRETVKVCEQLFAELEADTSVPTYDNTLGKLIEIWSLFDKVYKPVSVIQGVDEREELREVVEQIQQLIMPLGLKSTHSRPFYDRLVSLSESAEHDQLSVGQKKYLKECIRGRKIAGVDLEDDKKAELLKIMQRMQELSLKFSHNILDRTKEYEIVITDRGQLSGLGDDSLALLSDNFKKKKAESSTVEQGPWLIQLDGNSTTEILRCADSRELRHEVYGELLRIGTTEGKDNRPLVTELLELRHRKADILGYKNYSDLVLEDRMARSVDEILGLGDQVIHACEKPYEEHLEKLQKYKESMGDHEPLTEADMAYWTQKYKKESFGYDTSDVRPYLPYKTVLQGLFSLVERLFAVQLKEVKVDAEYLLDEHVQVFDVYDAGAEEPRSQIVIDPFARPGTKGSGAWMQNWRNFHVDRKGQKHKARAHVVCNFWPPTEERDSLLSWRDVETIFHEFGHALQQVLSTVEVNPLSGTSGVEWDAVELPSQFMENWCYHPSTVRDFTAHYESGEPLPDDLFQKILESRNFGSAAHYMSQVCMAKTDLLLHCGREHAADPESLFKEILHKTLYMNSKRSMHPDRTKWLYHFGHVFAGGYSAGYYSYLWAEVMSADAFSVFERAGLDDGEAVAKAGKSFRDTVLALGGSEDASEVYQRFAGRDATPEALLRHRGLVEVASEAHG